MTADDLHGTLEAWTRRLTQTLAVEVALVWPLGSGVVGGPETMILGLPDRVRLRPRDVFVAAMMREADAVAVVHTHLTDRGPSAADHAVTRRLVAAGAVLGVPLLAHLLVEPGGAIELIAARRVVWAA